jgi:hypothetical protein
MQRITKFAQQQAGQVPYDELQIVIDYLSKEGFTHTAEALRQFSLIKPQYRHALNEIFSDPITTEQFITDIFNFNLKGALSRVKDEKTRTELQQLANDALAGRLSWVNRAALFKDLNFARFVYGIQDLKNGIRKALEDYRRSKFKTDVQRQTSNIPASPPHTLQTQTTILQPDQLEEFPSEFVSSFGDVFNKALKQFFDPAAWVVLGSLLVRLLNEFKPTSSKSTIAQKSVGNQLKSDSKSESKPLFDVPYFLSRGKQQIGLSEREDSEFSS